MVQEVHHALMQSTRVREHLGGHKTVIPTRAWRSRLVYVSNQPPTLFHRPSNVQASMNRFFDFAAVSTFLCPFQFRPPLTSYLYSP